MGAAGAAGSLIVLVRRMEGRDDMYTRFGSLADMLLKLVSRMENMKVFDGAGFQRQIPCPWPCLLSLSRLRDTRKLRSHSSVLKAGQIFFADPTPSLTTVPAYRRFFRS
jgi:hypothetical protein